MRSMHGLSGSVVLPLCADLGAILCSAAGAQTPPRHPSRPVTIIVPIAPAAAQDIETRLYLPRLTEGLED